MSSNDAHEYRLDIQLLRAVAVILVLGFHLGVAGFGNGFLGVDIFFAISGYLMQILYRRAKGPVAFWKRRAARLLPAYFTAVAATLAAGALILLPDAFDQTAGQAIVAAFFASNVGYWASESYFAVHDYTPLLHLWSLGVELQFYLFVPLFAVWARRGFKLWLLMAVSLAACLAMTLVSPKTSFFLTPFRLWEFGAGMAVALWRQQGRVLPQWAFVVALAGMVGLLAWPLDGRIPSVLFGHPAAAAVIAILLTSVCLASSLPDRWLSHPIARPAVHLGDISYSLYLVHFPIVVFAFYQPFGGTRLGDGSWRALSLIPLILITAEASYWLVERRLGRLVTWPRLLLASLATVTLAACSPRLKLEGLDPYQRHLFASFDDRAEYRCGKTFRLIHPTADFCALSQGGKGTVLLIGDSHSDSIKESFAAAAAKAGLTVLFPVNNESLLSSRYDGRWLAESAKKLGADHIYLDYHSDHLTTDVLSAGSEAARQSGAKLAVIMPVPEASVSIPQLLYEARVRGLPAPRLDLTGYDRRFQGLRDAIRKHPDIEMIEVTPTLCPDGRCDLAATDGTPFYFDANHLTLTGAARLEPLFVTVLSATRASSGAKSTARTGTAGR